MEYSEDRHVKTYKKDKKNNKERIKYKIRRKFKIIRILIMSVIFLTLCMILLVWIKYSDDIIQAEKNASEKIQQLNADQLILDRNTIVYYDDGSVMKSVNPSGYEYVTFDDVSGYITDGYVAVEDKNFYEHKGIDPFAIIRAGLAYVKNKGTITQGGSTITQQTVKNNLLTSEKSLERKLTEIFAAVKLEKMYNKQQIMEIYLNTNFYGSGCYGIESACQYFFGCSAKDVTISQAAALVGMSNAPTRYNPLTNHAACVDNRNWILNVFREEGVINEEEYQNALNDPLEIVGRRKTQNESDNSSECNSEYNSGWSYSYAIHCAVVELMKENGFAFRYIFTSEDDEQTYNEEYNTEYNNTYAEVLNNGYKIYTSIQKDKQNALIQTVNDSLKEYTEISEDGRFSMQSAAVCIDNDTNYIVAVVGGRNSRNENENNINDSYNRAYMSARQPGSAIKPVLDYGPAFDSENYYPSLRCMDSPLSGDYNPKNFDNTYWGNITIRQAIINSTNTIPVKILMDIGIDNCISYLNRMQFSHVSYKDNNNASIAIGGFTNGVTPVEMAKAFNAIENNGRYSDRTCIKTLRRSNGEIIKNEYTQKYTQIYKDSTAWMLTDCLKEVFEKGYSRQYAVSNQICAGKTGTTNNSKDVWFCGYTPYYTTVVWIGYDTPKELPFGSSFANKVWQDYMNIIHAGLNTKDFVKPDNVSEYYIDWNGNPCSYTSGITDYFSNDNPKINTAVKYKDNSNTDGSIYNNDIYNNTGDNENHINENANGSTVSSEHEKETVPVNVNGETNAETKSQTEDATKQKDNNKTSEVSTESTNAAVQETKPARNH